MTDDYKTFRFAVSGRLLAALMFVTLFLAYSTMIGVTARMYWPDPCACEERSPVDAHEAVVFMQHRHAGENIGAAFAGILWPVFFPAKIGFDLAGDGEER